MRVVAEADHGEGDDAGQDADGEQVLDEADGRPVADAGDGEGAGEQVAVGLDDREQQHDEAPERGGVRRAGHRPLEQLALADHLGRLGLQVPAQVGPRSLDPLGSRLPGQRQPLQPPQPAPGHRERHRGQHQADDNSQDHSNLPERSEVQA